MHSNVQIQTASIFGDIKIIKMQKGSIFGDVKITKLKKRPVSGTRKLFQKWRLLLIAWRNFRPSLIITKVSDVYVWFSVSGYLLVKCAFSSLVDCWWSLLRQPQKWTVTHGLAKQLYSDTTRTEKKWTYGSRLTLLIICTKMQS